MEPKFFDLSNPFERQVSERLDQYLKMGLEHDTVLEMIGRDFPYMDANVRGHCEDAAFLYYYTGCDGNTVVFVKDVKLVHSKHMDRPLHSHLEDNFHIRKGDDIIAAVLVENPLYLYDKANVYMAFYVNEKKVNEFRHTMDMMDRRNVYYVPLNILENTDLAEEAFSKVRIEVRDENVKGLQFDLEPGILYSETDPSEIFSLDSISIGRESEDKDMDAFDLNDIDHVSIRTSIKYTEHFGHLDDIGGIAAVTPANSSEPQKTFITRVNLNSCIEEGSLFGFTTLFDISGQMSELEFIPQFRPEPGKYIISFSVMDSLLWSKEIEFFKGEKKEEAGYDEASEYPDFDTMLEEFIKEMEAEPVKDTVQEISEPEEEEVDPFTHIEVVGLNLYNIDSDKDNEEKCLNGLSSQPQTSFAADGMQMLSVIGKLKVIRDTPLLKRNDILKWTIYDQTGRMMDWHFAKRQEVKDELWYCAAFGDFCTQHWEKGIYRLELTWQTTTIINAAFTVSDINVPSEYEAKLISRRDNNIINQTEGSALARLDRMAGLEKVKDKIHSLMNFHKLQQMRSAAGLPVKQPALHARFLGNPGTGKTTVARLLGQIYKEMGLLSSGHVVLEERKNLIGRYYDSEGQAVDNALNRAKGGILLIDEAYNLYVENDEKDPGRRILEYLLTALSDENNRDWMLILAGYPEETTAMLKSNPGIDSRVEEVFVFEDLSIENLLQIADLYCDDNKYELSEEARKRLKSLISKDIVAKGKNFGNGRYVNKLLERAISTRMATRLSKISAPTYDQLVTIEAEDIPVTQDEDQHISLGKFDEEAIDNAMKRLDALVGLEKVKSAIHNFVNVSRYLNSQGERFRGKGLLKWNFTGNTGTGKSTVAKILADILKAMNLIQNSELTEVKGEEIFNVSDYECNEVIREAVKRSRKGVLFIDGDAPEFRSGQYRMTSEQVRFKLANLVSDDNASGALIISECSTPDLSIAHSLASNGIYDFDHTFIFDDYTEDELYSILLQCLDKYRTQVSEKAEVIIKEYIRNLCANRNLSFANARTMKNLSRAIFERMILRLNDENDTDAERIVLASDVSSFVWKKVSGKIGF